MAESTAIEWADHTFNPWIGCAAVSPACDNCYAERFAKRLGVGWGPHAKRRFAGETSWKRTETWNRKAAREGVRRRVFGPSLADPFDNAVPIAWLLVYLDHIRQLEALDWLLLTKRPQIILRRLREAREDATPKWGTVRWDTGPVAEWLDRWLGGEPPANVWLGTTAENQAEADRRIPHLVAVPARVRFLSCEPLLGPVNLRKWLDPWTCADCEFHGSEADCGPDGCGACGEHHAFAGGDLCKRCGADDQEAKPACPNCGSHRSFQRDHGFKFDNESKLISWIITGGESGPRARPSHPDWFRDLRDQCADASVPFFFKQWGEWGADTCHVGKKAAGRLLDGAEHSEAPHA